MKKTAFLALGLSLALLLTACGGQGPGTTGPSGSGGSSGGSTSAGTPSVDLSQIDTSQMFSDRDYEAGYDDSRSAHIRLNGSTASCDSNAVQISGSTVTITDEGTYILSGTLDDGMIIVNTDKTDKTQLVLNGVTIHSENCAPIYILQSDKVFITLAEGTENTLSNGGTFTAMDGNNIDAVVFSKEDVTFNGSGSLTINSPGGHGIVSKDDLTITGGVYTINSASHGMTGKDSVAIAGAAVTIAAGKDGIQADNDEDAALGTLYVESGTFQITAEGDGLSAGAWLLVENGTFSITTGGGSENAQHSTSNGWGDFMGGMGGMGGGGMGGGRPNGGPGGGGMGRAVTSSGTDSGEDSTSIKGLKAAGNLFIRGGAFTLDCADDAVHSNASISVTGGTFDIATGDDGFHADDTLEICAGTVSITESYEGLEGLHVIVSGGDIKLKASDDGLNAAGGTDSSGMGGFRGGDKFGGGASNGSILISGGNLYVNASGDGIDANGTLTISGGYTVVVGPTTGDTATLDYDTSAVITGGTFIGTGASGMAQTFSASEQGVFAVTVGSQAAGTQITLKDASGKELISYAPELSFGVVILSSPELVTGQSYTIYVGSQSGTFAAQ